MEIDENVIKGDAEREQARQIGINMTYNNIILYIKNNIEGQMGGEEMKNITYNYRFLNNAQHVSEDITHYKC